MNYSTAVFLINKNVRAVHCCYDPPADPLAKRDVTLFKTLYADLKKGDLVVVPTTTRVGFTVVQVEAVDVDFDPHMTCNVEWIVGRIDVAEYKRMKGLENDAISKIKKAEANRAREELRKSLNLDNPEVASSALANASVVALAPPTVEG